MGRPATLLAAVAAVNGYRIHDADSLLQTVSVLEPTLKRVVATLVAVSGRVPTITGGVCRVPATFLPEIWYVLVGSSSVDAGDLLSYTVACSATSLSAGQHRSAQRGQPMARRRTPSHHSRIARPVALSAEQQRVSHAGFRIRLSVGLLTFLIGITGFLIVLAVAITGS